METFISAIQKIVIKDVVLWAGVKVAEGIGSESVKSFG